MQHEKKSATPQKTGYKPYGARVRGKSVNPQHQVTFQIFWEVLYIELPYKKGRDIFLYVLSSNPYTARLITRSAPVADLCRITHNRDTSSAALSKADQGWGRYHPCSPTAETPPRAAQGPCRGIVGAGGMGE